MRWTLEPEDGGAWVASLVEVVETHIENEEGVHVDVEREDVERERHEFDSKEKAIEFLDGSLVAADARREAKEAELRPLKIACRDLRQVLGRHGVRR